jgi:hypothetical protein
MVLVMGTAMGLVGRRSALVVACVCVAAVAGGGWALAATSSGVLHGCANKKTGALRLAAKCKTREKVVSWNAKGQTGLTGLQGATGQQGARGAMGATGATGATGAQGPVGPAAGPAGGALAGSYPDPTLNVTGGDSGATACANNEALAGISTLAVLTCKPGVLADTNTSNTAAGVGAIPGDAGSQNSAFGDHALNSGTGQDDSAFGAFALASLKGFGFDTAIGEGALQNLTGGMGGIENTAVGDGAGGLLKMGSANVLIGTNAGIAYTGSETNNIDIGTSVNGTAGESNVTSIGSNTSKTFISGISGVTTGGTAVPVLIDSSGQLGVTSSSRRFKRDIGTLGESAVDALMKLQPVSFRYRASVAPGPWPPQFGLIAEQVAKVLPNLVAYGRDGKPDAIAYQEFPALLLAEIQRQQREISALRSSNRKLEHQQAQINWLMHHARLH